MAGNIGVVSLNALHHEDAQYTFLVSGTVTTADIGKAVTIDSAAANTVKLAGDNDVILGRLESFEDRTAEGIKVGAVSCEGAMKFLVNEDAVASPTDETPTVGDYICGGTTDASAKGYVQKIGTGGQQKWLVVEEASDHSYVIALKV